MKEAFTKALGFGLYIDMTDVRCVDVDTEPKLYWKGKLQSGWIFQFPRVPGYEDFCVSVCVGPTKDVYKEYKQFIPSGNLERTSESPTDPNVELIEVDMDRIVTDILLEV